MVTVVPGPLSRLVRQALIGLALGLAAMLAACSSPARTDAGSATTSTQATPLTSQAPTSTTAGAEAAVLAAYRAYWGDIIAAGKPPTGARRGWTTTRLGRRWPQSAATTGR